MTTLVLGASGKTGGLVAAELERRGLPVRRASRMPRPGWARFDWTDPSGWGTALAGVESVYLVTPTVPDFAADSVAEFAAAAAGVRRLVLLSGLSATYGSRPMLSRETPIRDGKTPWTILRPGQFAQNFSEGARRQSILDGEFVMPAGPLCAFIDVRDIAAVAVEALTSDDHIGRIHELSGPQALSFPQAIETISAGIGRPVRYVDLPDEEWFDRQRAAGASPVAVEWSRETLAALRRGEYARVTDDVPRILDRPARAFDAYVADAVRQGVWD